MIDVDIGKCTGCRRCETACSFVKKGRTNRHYSRIRVLNLYEMGVDGPVRCVQCQERYCTKCPNHAISIGPLGQVIVSMTLCHLCGACETNCPVGAIELFEDIVYVCDLCDGKPRCVEACTEGALIWNPEKTEGPSRAGEKKATRKMNPSQKRQRHLKKKGEALRKQWRKVHA